MADDPTPARNPIKRCRDHRTARWLERGRTQRGRRKLVVALAAAFVSMFVITALCAAGFEWAPPLWVPAVLLSWPIANGVDIVSGRHSDAPRSELDEVEIARRDSARSTALDLTLGLTMIPVVYLIFGSVLTDGKDEHMAYAGGGMALVALVVGSFSPAMILAWSLPDHDSSEC